MDSAVTELIPDYLKQVLPDPDVLSDPSVSTIDRADVLDQSEAD